MIFGILILMAVFATFIVTHFLQFTPDQSPVDLASELSLILLSGIFLIAMIIVSRHVV